MDRLKKEWREAEIPEEMRLQARNLAWAKIKRPVKGSHVLRWSIAATTTIVVIVALWIGFRSQPRIENIESVEHMEPIQAEQIVSSVSESTLEPVTENVSLPPVDPVNPQQSDVVNKPVVLPIQVSAPTQEKERERIVLNFDLPESGARLIWIIDSPSNMDGDMQ